VFGYPVDSGTGAFMSPEAARLFGQRLSLAGAVNIPYIKDLSAQMEANAPNGGAWVAVELDQRKGLNAILFASGYGDGVYSSYWGYDASGQLVCLVTDFGLLSP
jgi:hypothetical protein